MSVRNGRSPVRKRSLRATVANIAAYAFVLAFMLTYMIQVRKTPPLGLFFLAAVPLSLTTGAIIQSVFASLFAAERASIATGALALGRKSYAIVPRR